MRPRENNSGGMVSVEVGSMASHSMIPPRDGSPVAWRVARRFHSRHGSSSTFALPAFAACPPVSPCLPSGLAPDHRRLVAGEWRRRGPRCNLRRRNPVARAQWLVPQPGSLRSFLSQVGECRGRVQRACVEMLCMPVESEGDASVVLSLPIPESERSGDASVAETVLFRPRRQRARISCCAPAARLTFRKPRRETLSLGDSRGLGVRHPAWGGGLSRILISKELPTYGRWRGLYGMIDAWG